MIKLNSREFLTIIAGHILAAVLLITCGCASTANKIGDWRDGFGDFDKLTMEDAWDLVRGKEAKKDETGWRTGPYRIDVPSKPAEWEWPIQFQDMPADDPPSGEPERGMFVLYFDTGKVYPYSMTEKRNCFRIRAKGGTNFNARCGDSMLAPIPRGEVEFRVIVADDMLDILYEGEPIGRKGKLGSKKTYLPIKLNGARLKSILVDPWGDRPMGCKYKAGEVRPK